MNRWSAVIFMIGCLLFAGMICIQGNDRLEDLKQSAVALDDSHMICEDDEGKYLASMDQENRLDQIVRLNDPEEYAEITAYGQTTKDFYVLLWKKEPENDFFYQITKASKDLTEKKEYSIYEFPEGEQFSSLWADEKGQLHMLTIAKNGRAAKEYTLTFSKGETRLELIRLQNLRRQEGALSYVIYEDKELYGILEDGTCLKLGNEAEEELLAKDCPALLGEITFEKVPIEGMTIGVRLQLSKEDMVQDGIWILAGCLLLLVIVMQISDHITYRKLTQVAKDLASGHLLPGKPVLLNRNGGMIWKSLAEISKNMSRYNYSKMMSFQAYYRFAPKKLEKLLGKDSVTDVQIGDVVELFGTIAIVSMEKKGQTDRKQLTEWLGARCETIIHQQAKHEGIKVAGNGSLSQMQLIFPEHPADALRFGTETLIEMEEKGLMRDMAHMTILLDTSKFSYGITGVDDEIFPFLIAPQTDALGEKLERFNELDIRMVMTEDTMLRLEEPVQHRFIGRIHIENKEVKLYQVLDVYKEQERNNRMKTDFMFQSALELFYRSDFYLARNTFAEVLKRCPDDLVAKYYMFRCEEDLNSQLTEVNYDLF